MNNIVATITDLLPIALIVLAGGWPARRVVVTCVAGVALNALSLPMPEQALSGLSFAGAAASPVALIALGLYLGGSTLRLRGLPAAMPTPQNVFILAGRYGGDVDFSGSVVVKTALVSLLLLPVRTSFVL